MIFVLLALFSAGGAESFGDTRMRVAVSVDGIDYQLDYHRLCAINPANFTARATDRGGFGRNGTHLVVNGYREADQHLGSIDFSSRGVRYGSLGEIDIDPSQGTISWAGQFEVVDESADPVSTPSEVWGEIRLQC